MIRSARRGRQGGWTLIEMLIVMAVIATLMAIGAGVFQGLGDVGKRRAAQQGFMNLVRKARNAARGEERSGIVIEQGGTRVRGVIHKIIGLWHCEGIEERQTIGADRKNGAVSGGEFVEAGKEGGAIFLRGGKIDCGRFPDYEVTDGVGAELWVRPEARQDMILVGKGTSYGLALDREGSILVARAWVKVGRGSNAQPLELTGTEMPIPVGKWSHVAFSYDRALMVLRINGIEVARFPPDPDPESEEGAEEEEGAVKPETRPIVPDKGARLEIGPVFGVVDEVRVTGVLSADTIDFPEDVRLECASPMVRFHNGKLDTEFHSGPVEATFDFAGRRRRRILISLSGVASEQ